MADYPDPAYPLSEILEKAKVGFVHFRRDALDDAAALEMTQHDIVACILELKEADFDKSHGFKQPQVEGMSPRRVQANLLRIRTLREAPVLAGKETVCRLVQEEVTL